MNPEKIMGIINFFRVFKDFKEDTNEWLSEIKKRGPKKNKCISDAQENTNIRLVMAILG